MASSEPLLGSIAMFGGNFAPRGYALCQGQLMSIAQNTALFSILGTTFGGDGVTTFGLPDLRGRFPVQQGPGPGLTPVQLGEVSGTPSVTILTTQMPQHTHTVAAVTTSASAPSPASNFPAAQGDPLNPVNAFSPGPANTTMNAAMIGGAGSSQPVNIQNPYLGVNFIIALQGIFPSRN
jgi:microcystin-dependent protein